MTAASLALLVLLLPVAVAGPAAAAPPPAGAPAASDTRVVLPQLPRPTGPFAVGQETLHLVDRSRTDPWAGSGPRELMVTMRYPAHRGTGKPAPPWLTHEEARLLLADRDLGEAVAVESLVGTKAHARSDARPVAGRYPLIVLSPGFTVPRATLTSLAEELASRGHVVAAVDHAYETSGTAFPGGRVLTCLACDKANSEEGAKLVTDNRARDVSFLLDRLTGRHPAWRNAGLIDPGRIGMAGHSIGGSAAVAAMAADPRIRAGIDMDGGVFSPVPEGGLGGRPFMLLGAEESRPGNTGTGAASWDPNWKRLDGWKRWITLDASHHFTFTDWPTMSDQLGLPPLTPLPGARSVDLTRRYVGAFFDQHLKGVPQPLLDGPDPQAPEVRFHTP